MFGKPPSIAHFLFRALFSIVFVLQMAVAGAAWTWVGFWLRYVLMAAIVLATVIGGVRTLRRKVDTLVIVTWRERIDLLLAVGLFALFATSLPQLAGRRQYDGIAVELAFPLHGERYVPVHGGQGVSVNMHQQVKAQSYAIDLVQLGALSMRAAGILPAELSRYVIYGRSVHAPCAGEVIAARGDLPDQVPPTGDTVNLAGNHVVLFCKDVSVLLAHLKPGSLKVAVGDQVALDAVLGDVGNSGNTSEPHLHIHAVRGRVSDLPALVETAEPVPMLFPPGRFLTRNDVISN
ncbi:MAG: M23 family metallopeptidase [Deltaproteobacteria bacterium]|nr:M23 family metallopeptidase [Deltaproteobacteria bacterium]